MPDLRWSLFAGEQLTLAQARAWADAAPGSTLENLYGPTELTVTCTRYQLPADPARWPRTSNDTVPIGRDPSAPGGGPAGGRRDRRGRRRALRAGRPAVRRLPRPRAEPWPVRRPRRPPDDAGRRPARPGELVPDGDRVRREDGELVHLGRLDDQVKIHGYRIELGEIESVLRRHPGVHDVVVLALPGAGAVELHALYTCDTVAEAALAALVADHLPPYMAPARYHRVEFFPVNANGKVDRRRLAAGRRTGLSGPDSHHAHESRAEMPIPRQAPPARLRFRLMGPVEFHDGVQWRGIGSAKQRALLAMLLLKADQVVSLEQLVAELWDDDPPASASGLVAGYAWRLRRALNDRDGRVLTTRSPATAWWSPRRRSTSASASG